MGMYQTPLGINKNSLQAQGLVGWWPVTNQDRNSIVNLVTGDRLMQVVNPSHVGSEFRSHFDDGHVGISVTGAASGDDEFYKHSSESRYQITGDCTISGRFNISAYLGSAQALFCQGTTGETEATNFLWYIYRDNSGTLATFWESGAGTNTLITSTLGLSLNVDTIITIRRDAASKTVDFFVYDPANGIREDLGNSYTNNPTGGTSTTTNLGYDGAASVQPYQGRFCDLRVYNRALPLSLIREMQDPVKRYDLYGGHNPQIISDAGQFRGGKIRDYGRWVE